MRQAEIVPDLVTEDDAREAPRPHGLERDDSAGSLALLVLVTRAADLRPAGRIANRADEEHVDAAVRAAPIVGQVGGFVLVGDVLVAVGVGRRDLLPVEVPDAERRLRVQLAGHLDGVLDLGEVVRADGADRRIDVVADQNDDEVEHPTRERLQMTLDRPCRGQLGDGHGVAAGHRAEDPAVAPDVAEDVVVDRERTGLAEHILGDGLETQCGHCIS